MESTKTEWWDSDDVQEIMDQSNKFKYLKTDVINDALNGSVDMDDFLWSLQRQEDKVKDELAGLMRVVEQVRRRQK